MAERAERAPRVLFAALYPSSQAGTRLRAEAFFDDLRAAGLEPELFPFMTEADSASWFGRASLPRRLLIVLKSVLRTAAAYLRLSRYDAVVVLREAVPFATAAFERRAAKVSQLVWDVDDAIWTPYPRMFLAWLPDRLRRSERKYEELARLSSDVWAGSEGLAQWCRQHADRVWVLPTVPVLPRELPGHDQRHGVVWIGSSSTGGFLAKVLPHLAAADGEAPVALTVVGAQVDPVPGVDLRCLPWSEEVEDRELRRALVGLYPIDLEHPLGAARAGFKAVLYMAYGLPAVVTPVTAVQELVRDGVDGVHAHRPEDWGRAVRMLLEDADRWQAMSDSAHERAALELSSHVWAPKVAQRLESARRRSASPLPRPGGVTE